MKLIRLSLLMLFANALVYSAMPQNMRVEILNQSRKPMNIKWTEKPGTSINNKDFKQTKLGSGQKTQVVVANEYFPVEAVVETGNEYEISYNPTTVKVEIKRKVNVVDKNGGRSYRMETVQEIPATANLKYTATLD